MSLGFLSGASGAGIGPQGHPCAYDPEYVRGLQRASLVRSHTGRSFPVRVGTDSNIALSGGVTVFTGVGERMRKELRSLAPSTVKMKVGAPRPSERLQ